MAAASKVARFGLAAPSAPELFTSTTLPAANDNQDVNGDGTIDIAITVTWLGVANAVRYEVEVSRSATAGGTFTVTGKGGATASLVWTFSANVNFFYKVRVRGFSFNGTPGSWTTALTIAGGASQTFSTYAGFQPVKKTGAPATPAGLATYITPSGVFVTWDYPTEGDYSYTLIQGINAEDIKTKTNGIFYNTFPGDAYADPVIRHVNTSGVAGPTNTIVISGTALFYTGNYIANGTIELANMANDSVDTGTIVDNAINENFASGNNVSQALAAGTRTKIEECVVTHPSGTNVIEVHAACRNNSGSGRVVEFTIEDGGGAVYATYLAAGMSDGAWVFPFARVNSPTGTSTTLRLYATMVTAGSLINTKLTGLVRKR